MGVLKVKVHDDDIDCPGPYRRSKRSHVELSFGKMKQVEKIGSSEEDAKATV